jgi:hypothetical protein
MKALLIYPTHKNCREVEKDYTAAGINAATYPGRTTEDSEEIPQNCWNPDANWAEAIGLPVVKTICPSCQSRKKCQVYGYLGDLIAVANADVGLCTHKRAEFSSLTKMSSGCSYVSIHEDPVEVLRPAVSLAEQDLYLVQRIINRLVSDPDCLNWFGNAMRTDDEGNRYEDEELAIRKDRQLQFCVHTIDMLDALIGEYERAEKTTKWLPKVVMKCPTGMERTLFIASRTAKAVFQGQAWRFTLAAAAGQLQTAAIIVNKRFIAGGGQDNAYLVKAMSGFKDNLPAPGATTWFNDATSTRERLEGILGRQVHDMTPGGRIEFQKKRVQVLRDITYRTTPGIFANIIRGVLADRPQFQRIGVICLSSHIEVLKDLGDDFNHRIVKSTYFGSGEDRSSNDWYKQCDLIVIAGTPRIPPQAIGTYLVQVGEVDAACEEPPWGTLYWDGQTESGEAVRVKSRGYQDEAWRRAHRDLVRSQLVQAIGRGRGILEDGCEVLVVSTEECGLVISDVGMEALNGTSTKVLKAIRDLTMENPKDYLLGFSIVSTRQVASRTGLSVVRAREVLRGLERRGLVRKVGERGGWALVVQETAADRAEHSECEPTPTDRSDIAREGSEPR